MKEVFFKIWKRNESTTPQPTIELKSADYIKFKGSLRKKTLLGSLITLGAVITGASAIWSYIYDFETTPVKLFGKAANHLNDDDIESKQLGFDTLEKALYVKKRVFSGVVVIPTGGKLVSPEVVSSLVENCDSPDSNISLSSLTWIYKSLMNSGSSGTVQNAITSSDPEFRKLSKALYQTSYYDHQKHWLTAAHILLKLDLKNTTNPEHIQNGIKSMAKSDNPIAIAAAAELHRKFENFKDDENTNELFKKLNESHALNQSITDISLHLIPGSSNTLSNFKADIFTTLIFSTFAAVYGKIMWTFRSSLSSAYREIKKIDPEKASSKRRLFLRERIIGRSVFTLLFFDLMASTFLSHASGEDISFVGDKPIRIPPEYRYNYPLSSLYPIIQTTIFLLGALWIIRQHRFVVLPLVLSGCYYHQDLLIKYGLIDTVKTNYKLSQ